MRGLDLPTLVIAHAWVLIAFTVLVGALCRILREPGPRYWLYSDFSGLFSLFGGYLIFTNGKPVSLIIFGFSTYLTMFFRVLAVSTPVFASTFKRVGLTGLGMMVLLNLLLAEPAPLLRTLMNTGAFVAVCGSMVYVLIWQSDARSNFGRVLIISSTFAYIAIAVLRALHIFDSGMAAVNQTSSFNTVWSTILMLIGIFAHIGFLIIVLDRLHAAESQAAQALVREAERRRNAEERERESSALADEQKRLVEVLTHEVRQPLNNASAALQSIGDELVEGERQSQNLAIMRAQDVIDRVSMALSNALVAATILERRQKFNPVRYAPMLLVDMVIMDFNEKERNRIVLDDANAPLYISADPVLLRIALRNLLDNALRYSSPGSKITLQVNENEQDIGAEFRVINSEPLPDAISEVDIFKRRVRGQSADTDGSGMGLYITAEIAKLHQGWVRTWHDDGQRIFALFIQD